MHKLTLLDRVRGWHWVAIPVRITTGEQIAVIHRRRRNYCGCFI